MSDHPEPTEAELKQIIGSLELGSIVAANNREQIEVKPQSLQRVLLLARKGLEADAMRDALEGLRIELCNRLDLDYTATTDAEIVSALEAARQETVGARVKALSEAATVCKKHGAHFHDKSKNAKNNKNKLHEFLFSGSEAGALMCGETLTALALEAAAGTGEQNA